jgi:hypothetical protein
MELGWVQFSLKVFRDIVGSIVILENRVCGVLEKFGLRFSGLFQKLPIIPTKNLRKIR